MGLSPRRERAERLAELRRWLEDFHSRHGDEDLAWITTPSLIARSPVFHHERRAALPLSEERGRSLLREQGRYVDESWALHDGHLFLGSTENQRLAQGPIARLLGEAQPRPAPVAVPEARADELGRRAIALGDELMHVALEESVEPPRRRVYLQLARAAANLGRFEAVLEAAAPRAVVIGSTHSISARALVLAARRAGIPSVYVPHAPVTVDARLVDLPVDFAAVRGPREVAHYARFGARRRGMTAIGDPAFEGTGAMPELRRDAPPVFAPHAFDERTLGQLIDLIAEGLRGPVTVSPHPRADRDAVKGLLPPGWDLWDGRTLDLLHVGPRAVLAMSSGVALEAMQLGLPTIELAFPGEEPNYPFVRHPEVRSASTAEELRRAVAAASGVTAERRASLRAWAQGWVCAHGDEAAEAGAALIRRAVERGPRRAPVWDAWRLSRLRRRRRLFARTR
jgi:hypothetical protein